MSTLGDFKPGDRVVLAEPTDLPGPLTVVPAGTAGQTPSPGDVLVMDGQAIDLIESGVEITH